MLPRAFVLVALGTLTLVACGGGGGGGSSSTPTTIFTTTAPTPTPTAAPTAAPFPSMQSFTTATTIGVAPGSSSISLPLPASGTGFAGQATFPIASADPGTQITETFTNQLPNGLAALSLRRPKLVSDGTVLLYVCFTSTGNVTGSGTPAFTFALPSGFTPSGVAFYLAIQNGSQWSYGYGGPGSVSGTTVNLTGVYPITFTPNAQLCFALYAQSVSDPTPTPATPTPAPSAGATATSTPTPTPGPQGSPGTGVGITITVPTAAPIVVVPSSYTFTGSGQTQSSQSLSQAGYAGPFTVVSTNASVAVGSATQNDFGNYVLTITSTGKGSCTLNLSSLNGGTGSVSVTVTGP